jgi:hypothetical protein
MTCEHAFGVERARHTRMTSQGSAYSRFKRALATGNPLLIRSTAAELPRIELADALAIAWHWPKRTTTPTAASRRVSPRAGAWNSRR